MPGESSLARMRICCRHNSEMDRGVRRGGPRHCVDHRHGVRWLTGTGPRQFDHQPSRRRPRAVCIFARAFVQGRADDHREFRCPSYDRIFRDLELSRRRRRAIRLTRHRQRGARGLARHRGHVQEAAVTALSRRPALRAARRAGANPPRAPRGRGRRAVRPFATPVDPDTTARLRLGLSADDVAAIADPSPGTVEDPDAEDFRRANGLSAADLQVVLGTSVVGGGGGPALDADVRDRAVRFVRAWPARPRPPCSTASSTRPRPPPHRSWCRPHPTPRRTAARPRVRGRHPRPAQPRVPRAGRPTEATTRVLCTVRSRDDDAALPDARCRASRRRGSWPTIVVDNGDGVLLPDVCAQVDDRTAVNRLPNDRADTRARLLAALDGVAVSVERRLTPPGARTRRGVTAARRDRAPPGGTDIRSSDVLTASRVQGPSPLPGQGVDQPGF